MANYWADLLKMKEDEVYHVKMKLVKEKSDKYLKHIRFTFLDGPVAGEAIDLSFNIDDEVAEEIEKMEQASPITGKPIETKSGGEDNCQKPLT